METFRTPFEMEIDVKLEDPDRAQKYFIEGDDFKSYFWTFKDLSEVARSISYAFHDEGKKWDVNIPGWTKFVEGYGTFVKGENDVWRLTDTSADYGSGHIIVSYHAELKDNTAYAVQIYNNRNNLRTNEVQAVKAKQGKRGSLTGQRAHK